MSRIDFPKIYNPANQTPEELVKNFVVRTKIFKEIFDDIKNSKMEYPEQHYIIQGVRGQGKTTLLLRIAYEIDNDTELRQRIIPIIFNEEQYSISRLFKLWETTAEYLQEDGEITGLYTEMQKFENNDDYERRCFELLEDTLKKHKKKLTLFIDNIDEMLSKFSKKEHQRLREIFMESAELRLIGASSVSLEFHYDYGKPFYQFFKMPQLKGVTTAETKALLLKLGEHYKRERVKEIVKNQPGRIEGLRRITGGVIRTIVILFEIFVDDINGNAFMDLEKILDSVTPLYKHRMDKLSPQQQEIVDFIALNWDAVSTREIAGKTKLESKAVSAQLKQLEKYHIIEKEKTDTKNFLYRISERFFNVWYLMRLGRNWDEKRVRFLVEFLQIWCDEQELAKRAAKHLDAVKQGKLYEKQALYMTEALARTPIQREFQHQLISETRTYLDEAHSELKDYLSKSDKELYQKSKKAFESNDFEKAIQLLEQIKLKDPDDLTTLGFLYQTSKIDVKKAEEYYLKAVEKENSDAMYNLALLYQTEFKDFKKAEQYYLMAVEKEHAGAMYNLALLYQTGFKDFEKAEQYYLMAVGKEHSEAMYNLALLYKTEFKNFKKAEQYYLMAVEKEHSRAMNNLAGLYFAQFKNIKKAKKFALMAVEKGNSYAMTNLAMLYKSAFKNFEKAEQYYLMAIEREHIEAMNDLARMFLEQKRDNQKCLKYAKKAYENRKTSVTAHTYATALLWNNEIEKAYETAQGFLGESESFEKFPEDTTLFLLLLIAKKQYHLTLKIFTENPHNLKDRFKPIYYALMYFMQNEFPNEYRKMGGELKQTVEEIIEKIHQLEKDYN